jgi:hypothetical protein
MKKLLSLILVVILILSGSCATFSPTVKGLYTGEPVKTGSELKSDVVFIFRHYEQTLGWDAVPRLTRPQYNFDDIFARTLGEIGNIGRYNSVTVNANDINDIAKRNNIDRLMKENDYTVEISINKQKSFAKFFFGVIVSSVSATVIPIRYRYNYNFEISIFDNRHNLVKSYTRNAALNKWVETLLALVYPFHTQKMEWEELYVTCLGDMFRQMDAEKVLDPGKLDKTTRTIYCHREISDLIEKMIPADAVSWKNNSLNEWVNHKDISIIIHFPGDGMTQAMADQAFRQSLETLDQKTEQEGLLYWVDKEEKNPLLLISARNETVLKAQLENNQYLKVLLNGMFYLGR